MNIIAVIAARFLASKKRNRFLSFVSGVSLFGVALGVSALVVVMGVMEGFENTLRSVITGTHSHIVLYSRRLVIGEVEEFAQRIKSQDPGIVAVSPFVFSEVMIAFKGKVHGSLLEGLDEKTIFQATNLQKHLSQGAFPEPRYSDEQGNAIRDPEILLGVGLAEKLGVAIGDTVSVISPFFEDGALQPRSQRFRVSGLTSTGMYEYDAKYSVVNLIEARSFFKIPLHSASAFKIKTQDPDMSSQLAQKLEVAMGFPYAARDWTELNRNLLYAIKLQKIVIFIVLTSIIIVAAFNIMSTLVMMMNEKKREMSILKAMGLSSQSSAAIFIIVGGIIGVSGAIFGSALGLVLGNVLARTRFIELPADVYFISYLPVTFETSTLVIIMSVSVAVALMATLYPSWCVARESPVEGLRYE